MWNTMCTTTWLHPFKVPLTCKGGPYRSKPRLWAAWLHWVSSWPLEHRYYRTEPPLTWSHTWCLSPRVPSQAGTYPCLSPWRVMSPGYEGPYSFISDGCPQRLVDDMMSCLWDMSDAAYCLTREAMDPYCSQLDDLSFCHGKETEYTWDLEDGGTEAGHMLRSSTGTHALTKARRALEQWMRCMPVVSFNGGRYDLQLIKPYLATVYGTYAPPWLHRFGLMRALNCRWPLTVCHPATGVGMRKPASWRRALASQLSTPWFPSEACDVHRAEFVDIMTRLGSPVLGTWHDNAARPVGCIMRRHPACSKQSGTAMAW